MHPGSSERAEDTRHCAMSPPSGRAMEVQMTAVFVQSLLYIEPAQHLLRNQGIYKQILNKTRGGKQEEQINSSFLIE